MPLRFLPMVLEMPAHVRGLGGGDHPVEREQHVLLDGMRVLDVVDELLLKISHTARLPRRFGAKRFRAKATRGSTPPSRGRTDKEVTNMVPLLILLVLLAIFGGLGFAVHVLWFVLIAAVILWLLGFVLGGVGAGVGRRRWYGRW